MIERHQIDNGKFLIPSGAQQPDWVIERINNFKDTIYGITKTSKDSDPETLKQMVKALEMFILPPNVKLTDGPVFTSIFAEADKVERAAFILHAVFSKSDALKKYAL